jgi:hypothetical protein
MLRGLLTVSTLSAALCLGGEASSAPQPAPTPSPLPTEKALLSGIAAPTSNAQDSLDTEGPATERLSPSLTLSTSSEPGLISSPSQSSAFGLSPELTSRQQLGSQGAATAPLPAAPRQATAALAPIPVSTPGTAAVRTSGAASRPLSANLAAVQKSVAFFTVANAALASSDATRAASIARQVLSPKGQGHFGTETIKSLTLTAGGIYYYDFVTTGQRVRTDLIQVGTLFTTATADDPFTFYLSAFSSPGKSGPLPSFYWDPRASYEWELLTTTDPFAFTPEAFALDDSGFQGNLQGGFFSLSATDTSLVLNFTPVPEPSTWLLLVSGGGLVAWLHRRSRAARS